MGHWLTISAVFCLLSPLEATSNDCQLRIRNCLSGSGLTRIQSGNNCPLSSVFCQSVQLTFFPQMDAAGLDKE